MFGCSKRGWRYVVWSFYPDNIERLVAGPFWSWQTAAKVAGQFVQHYRNGYDRRAANLRCRS